MQFPEAVNEFAEFLIPSASNLITQDDEAFTSVHLDFRACGVTSPSTTECLAANTCVAQNTNCAFEQQLQQNRYMTEVETMFVQFVVSFAIISVGVMFVRQSIQSSCEDVNDIHSPQAAIHPQQKSISKSRNPEQVKPDAKPDFLSGSESEEASEAQFDSSSLSNFQSPSKESNGASIPPEDVAQSAVELASELHWMERKLAHQQWNVRRMKRDCFETKEVLKRQLKTLKKIGADSEAINSVEVRIKKLDFLIKRCTRCMENSWHHRNPMERFLML
eukprot:GHVP01055229.1.p1 GENE.GHVP01055229.1~~GHVP01055229.1.p1  ORF type:complete len:276 (+),score=59.19 GHVP01055229.1:17-844(+)